MNYNEPSKEQIEALKAKFSDRSLHQIELTHDEDVYFFIFTGPNEEEYKKFRGEIFDAEALKSDKEQDLALRAAAKTAATAMIRHPDRTEVQRVFDVKPDFVVEFPKHIRKAAGSNVEVRSKKL